MNFDYSQFKNSTQNAKIYVHIYLWLFMNKLYNLLKILTLDVIEWINHHSPVKMQVQMKQQRVCM